MGSVPHATHQDKFLMAQRFKCKTVKPNTRKKMCEFLFNLEMYVKSKGSEFRSNKKELNALYYIQNKKS